MKNLKKKFLEIFTVEADHEYFAPGRINLIGEHTDYNGGHVFPCSISIGTYGVTRKRADKMIQVYSENFPDKGIVQFSLDTMAYHKEDDWANYPKGMLAYLLQEGYEFNQGLDILYYGTIPNGAGLSSSASIELLTGVIAREEFCLSCSMLDLVNIGKKVENDFIGVNSGIMDQFAIGMGKKDEAILLDCNTLKYERVPVKLGEYVIAIMNTNKRRELADSKYNERRDECEKALQKLQIRLNIQSLGELNEEMFEQNKQWIGDEVLVKRARHAISENQRTLRAKAALKKNDLETFGKLMNASHESLRENYEVTGIELDTLVKAAQKCPNVLGARMTGAGFGGCGIAIVKESYLSNFITKVGKEYQEKIGYAADFYKVLIGDGAGKL